MNRYKMTLGKYYRSLKGDQCIHSNVQNSHFLKNMHADALGGKVCSFFEMVQHIFTYTYIFTNRYNKF